jgi:hypothetical protein
MFDYSTSSTESSFDVPFIEDGWELQIVRKYPMEIVHVKC